MTLLPELVLSSTDSAVSTHEVVDEELSRLIYVATRKGSLARPAIRAVCDILDDVCRTRADTG